MPSSGPPSRSWNRPESLDFAAFLCVSPAIQVLRASKGIEFQDYKYVHEARALLLRLREVKNSLGAAMKARFPEQLREALQAAQESKLQGIENAVTLLDKLDHVVDRLETAKGLTPLRAAIEAAESARLPEEIVVVARERLLKREAPGSRLELEPETVEVGPEFDEHQSWKSMKTNKKDVDFKGVSDELLRNRMPRRGWKMPSKLRAFRTC